MVSFIHAPLPWTCSIFPLVIYSLSWLIYSVLRILSHLGRTSTWGRAVSCVCVHLPAIGVYAMWLNTLLPLQFPYNTRNRGFSQFYLCMCISFACVEVRMLLTLDVYLLHLIDLCDSLSELLCKLPELLSTWGAETHQLLLFWGKRA